MLRPQHALGNVVRAAVGLDLGQVDEQRRIPFDNMPGLDNYLITFEGGDHMVFSGRSGVRGDRSKDETFQKLICTSSAAFWDAYLCENASAKAWLKDGGFKKLLGAEGKFELKAEKK